jgi:hypothetical protein
VKKLLAKIRKDILFFVMGNLKNIQPLRRLIHFHPLGRLQGPCQTGTDSRVKIGQAIWQLKNNLCTYVT